METSPVVITDIKYCKLCEKAFVKETTCPHCETTLENIGWLDNASNE